MERRGTDRAVRLPVLDSLINKTGRKAWRKEMPQIKRTASVIFGDADIVIRESRQRMPYKEENAWETQFKRQVFYRIVQTLNRLGWTCVVPAKDWHGEDPYGHRDRMRKMERECCKGDLSGELLQRGSTITFQMFQNVNAPNRPDHGGRYEFNKEAIMPYLLRLEMERTRRRIRDYLCNVFSGYYFDTEWMEKHSRKTIGPNGATAMEWALNDIRNSGHYREELGRASFNGDAQQSGDGLLIEHGGKAYAINRKGRVITGTAMYCLNGNWKIITGKYGIEHNIWHKQVFVNCPANPRRKRNDHLRRKRLESELNSAMARMDFRRAEILRDLIWPPGEPVFCLWHTEHKAYHCAGFSGYTTEQMEAGKFTRAELKGWENDRNIIVPFGRRP